jgi:hypothetical protein
MPEDSGPDARTIEIAHHCFDGAHWGGHSTSPATRMRGSIKE